MRRGYQTKRQYQRSLHREPDRVCGTCARFLPRPELVPGGVCGSTGEIVASVWPRPCWTSCDSRTQEDWD